MAVKNTFNFLESLPRFIPRWQEFYPTIAFALIVQMSTYQKRHVKSQYHYKNSFDPIDSLKRTWGSLGNCESHLEDQWLTASNPRIRMCWWGAIAVVLFCLVWFWQKSQGRLQCFHLGHVSRPESITVKRRMKHFHWLGLYHVKFSEKDETDPSNGWDGFP